MIKLPTFKERLQTKLDCIYNSLPNANIYLVYNKKLDFLTISSVPLMNKEYSSVWLDKEVCYILDKIEEYLKLEN